MLKRLRELPERWRWLRLILQVQRRFSELNGNFLASAVTLSVFLSLFPLLLVALAVLGFFSSGHPDFASDVIGEIGLTGTAAEQFQEAIAAAERSRRSASIIGVVGLLWTGMGMVAAFQNTVNAAWQTTGRGIRDKLYALVWLVGTMVLLAASFSLTGLLQFVPGPVAPLALLGSLAIHTLVFLWTFRVLGTKDVGWRPHLPGSVFAGIGFQALTALGAYYVPDAVSKASALYGSIGVVFAVLAWLLFFGRLLVYASVINVVLYERSHGTVTVEIEAPRVPGMVALGANRSGAVTESAIAES